jgi:hypothetical protein
MENNSFKVDNINDLELVYSILREKNPNNQINITFNYNTKSYTIQLSDKPYKSDPDVPLDLKIEVVYGDSIHKSEPILVRDPSTGTIDFLTIESVCSQWHDYPEFKILETNVRIDKQYGMTQLEVWCDEGWTKIKKVIRHKTDKALYKILSHGGSVIVTEDHSLLDKEKNVIKPSQCNLDTQLLTSYPINFNTSPNTISKERAFIYGFFFGDGSCCSNSWALNNQDKMVLKHLVELCKKEYPQKDVKIYDTLKSSGVYKLSLSNPKDLIHEYREKFYSADRFKKVPSDILNGSMDILQSFFDGYWASDGCRKDKETIGCTRFDVKGSIGAAGLYYVSKRLGYNVSVNTRQDMFRLTLTKKEQRKVNNKIKRIVKLSSSEDFVYDIETQCGRFNAGVGNIVVKNTDSIMAEFKFNRDDFEKNRIDTFNLATVCADKLTNDIFNRPPIVLEFEKVFQPFILLTKKRYIANKYENLKDPFQLKGLDAKGIALTRRDYCPMVKKCYKEVINAIMNREVNPIDAIHNSIKIFKSYISKIDKYDIEIDNLVVSAMLAKSYKTRPVHVILAEKLKERKEQVTIGDRIPYIYIESDDPKKQKSELGEDPQYAIKNKLKFNRACYLEQLAKPLLGFYKVVLQNNGLLLDDLIEDVNVKLHKYGAKKLKPSDFKIED